MNDTHQQEFLKFACLFIYMFDCVVNARVSLNSKSQNDLHQFKYGFGATSYPNLRWNFAQTGVEI